MHDSAPPLEQQCGNPVGGHTHTYIYKYVCKQGHINVSKYKGRFFFHVLSICKFLCKHSYMILYTWVPSKTCSGHHCYLIPPHGWFRYIRSMSNLQNHEHFSCGETCDGCHLKFSGANSFSWIWMAWIWFPAVFWVRGDVCWKSLISTCIQNSGRSIEIGYRLLQGWPGHPDRSNHYDIRTHSGFLFLFSS